MRNHKHIFALLPALVMALAMTATALAALDDTGFSDVAADAWYADAVVFCRDEGLMDGTSEASFSPDAPMTRAMLATVLYRAAGSPAVTGDSGFTDVAAGAWYSDAVTWAAENGIVSGYSDTLFGANDPATREQLVTLLWRYAGSPTPAGSAQDFADQSAISGYAVSAVAWARENNVVSGLDDNRFAPAGRASRAQVATILMNYSREAQPETEARVLIAYFSATGNTENIAEHLDAILDAELYEIIPEIPYTAADLNYNDASSRSQLELRDPSARPAISGSVENLEDYDTIFLGYPIWNGQAPKIISTFLESYAFDGKTIVPFCTSGSSGIGSSAVNLHALAPNAHWLSGQRFAGSAPRATVEAWVDGLDLPTRAETPVSAMQIAISDGTHTVAYALNDSQAARELYAQLPLTLPVENYSKNEKIFYPTTALSTAGAPQAGGGAGTLAYYAPWGDVVLFYAGFSANSQLYGLGTAISGADQIESLSGTITVTALA